MDRLVRDKHSSLFQHQCSIKKVEWGWDQDDDEEVNGDAVVRLDDAGDGDPKDDDPKNLSNKNKTECFILL